MPGTDIGTKLRGPKETIWCALQIIIVKQDGKYTLEKCEAEGNPNVDNKIRAFLNSLVEKLNSGG